MDDTTIARAIHVLAVVLWIGGVAMVTTVVLPAARRLGEPHEGIAMFQAIERRFAWQARATTLLAGISGFYMVDRLGLWARFLSIDYWWLDAMAALWLIFTAMLFVAEPLFAHRWFDRRAVEAPERALAAMERMHRVLLALALITIFGAVAGSHGLSLF